MHYLSGIQVLYLENILSLGFVILESSIFIEKYTILTLEPTIPAHIPPLLKGKKPGKRYYSNSHMHVL